MLLTTAVTIHSRACETFRTASKLRNMPIFGSRRSASPRLVPELDDTKLGRVRKQLQGPAMPGLMDIRIDVVQEVIRDAAEDWDRRTHRISVLAQSADPGLARAWLRRQPRDPDAMLFQAWTELIRARWDGGMDDPQEVVDLCRRAAAQRPADPVPWVVLVGVLRLLRRPQQEVFPVWREATARDPWHREAYLQMLGYLSPEECGSHVQVLDFVDAVRSGMPPGAPASCVELVAMVERYHRTVAGGGVAALMAGRHWSQPPASDALERALADWPRPGFLTHAATLADLNLLAYALVQANRSSDAARVFARIGTTVTAWPWALDGDPVEQFTHWLARSER